MNAVETLSLAKLVAEKAEKAARESVKPGVYHVDLTVRVRGAVNVAVDTEASQTARALSLEGVATALYFAGATREKALDALVRVAVGKETAADESRKEFVDGIVQAIKERFAALPKEPKRGAVKAVLAVEEIQTEVQALAGAA